MDVKTIGIYYTIDGGHHIFISNVTVGKCFDKKVKEFWLLTLIVMKIIIIILALVFVRDFDRILLGWKVTYIFFKNPDKFSWWTVKAWERKNEQKNQLTFHIYDSYSFSPTVPNGNG